MNKNTILILFVVLNYNQSFAAKISINTDYRFRILTYSNPDFTPPTESLSYSSHRLGLEISGSLTPEVELVTKFQTLGITGVSINSRYPDATFKTFVQNMFLKFNKPFNLPFDAYIGRQDLKISDGYLLCDDDLGFDSIKFFIYPHKLIDITLFRSYLGNTFTSDQHNLKGINFTLKHKINWDVFYLEDNDDATKVYYKTEGTTIPVSSINKKFYSLRLSGEKQLGYYKTEFLWQKGQIKSGDIKKLDGFGFILQLGGYAYFQRFRKTAAHIIFAQGSGDKTLTPDIDEGLKPTLSRQWDGLERIGWGEYYSATVFNVFPQSKNLQDFFEPTKILYLPNKASGVRSYGFVFELSPVNKLDLYLNYFVYTAIEMPTLNVGLGGEYDWGIIYKFTNTTYIKFSMANFRPGNTYQNPSNAQRVLLEFGSRF